VYIFVGYSEDVKGKRLLQPHFNEIIIRRDVKFDKNILAFEPNSASVPSLVCEPNSAFVPSSDCEPSSMFLSSHVLVSSSDDDSEDENPPSLSHLPPDESFEPTPAPSPSLPSGSFQRKKQLVILLMILRIIVGHVHSFSDPLLFWLKFQRLVI
jgi:hypothetical protein